MNLIARAALRLALAPILAGRWLLERRARGPFDPRRSRGLDACLLVEEAIRAALGGQR